MNNFRVQNAVFPKISLCSEERLYFRANALTTVSLTSPLITFAAGGKLASNTYFNSVSIGKIKKYTQLTDLNFTIRLKGKFKLIWKVKALNQSEKVWREDDLSADSVTAFTLDLPFWRQLDTGMLYFELRALTAGELTDFSYFTRTKSPRAVKLGMVITHFNRREQVLATAGRLQRELLADPDYAPYLDLCIIDNSRNLPAVAGVTVIKNPNLGGSGGFARGLSYFKGQSGITHCLFMDDDAAAEAESTRRTLFYLAFARDDKLTVAGAMLRTIAPNRQNENGARFSGICEPVKAHYDLLRVNDILGNEREERLDYGAWWYFAFPLLHLRYWPFPYFVRGDDISFSLANPFYLVTVNGIAVWQDDFAYKAGPRQIYLDQRSHVMHFLHGLLPALGRRAFFKTLWLVFILHLLNYQYESAHAATMALRDILGGDDYWRDNADMVAKGRQLQALTRQEVIVTIPAELRQSAVRANPQESRVQKWLRLISLNGHLIPRLFFKKNPIWQDKAYGVRLREVFRCQTAIFYTDDKQEEGIILHHNKKLFWQYLGQHAAVTMKIWRRRRQLQAGYKASYPQFTGEEFWRRQFARFDADTAVGGGKK